MQQPDLLAMAAMTIMDRERHPDTNSRRSCEEELDV